MPSRQFLRCSRSLSHIPKLQPPRAPLPQHVLSRTFHSTQQNHLVAEALQLSHTAFQEIHTFSGLPWCLSIPLTAALFRLSWIPILVVTNRNAKRRQTVSQLLVGWRKAYQSVAALKFPFGDEKAAKNAESWVSTQLAARQKSIEKHCKVLNPSLVMALQLSFLPIWIINADVVRRMTGDERTITSMLFKTNEKVDVSIVPAEPGLAAESLWWIPNLVSPDQLWILPLTFGTLSVTSAWMAVGRGKGLTRLERRVSAMEAGPMRTRESFYLQLSQSIIAASFIFPFLLIRSETATAVVLYLIASVGTQLVQRPLIGYLLGGSNALEPLDAKLPKMKGRKDDLS
ncbi:uncharacterized protein Z518_05949 [Rhinocladiella mackenziei CBS 650.93]|uniref:Rhinocladiella mackenziei CBS 650.93 unplaced genomic scaffold supercont1.4, whole genome shotgun sequence n=1 Tax=Rhinocladiella mackenziei CBS 650.93 TaxID=1442369 RepID=A0A0D2FSI6_9EURO|nr:uncharacterized protein Z518_05949 [Rhinocladiella mackenziei CBS 650.93]KIX05077.1 hypothetical protein Z518_05949 [Rhinocladiella mackenziei CBS 650.93]